MQVLVIQCRHLVLRNSFVVSPVLQSKDLLLRASCVISRVLVLQSQDLLLPALLDDAVSFALILEEFLGHFLCYDLFLNAFNENEGMMLMVWKSVCEREIWFVLPAAEC